MTIDENSWMKFQTFYIANISKTAKSIKECLKVISIIIIVKSEINGTIEFSEDLLDKFEIMVEEASFDIAQTLLEELMNNRITFKIVYTDLDIVKTRIIYGFYKSRRYLVILII